MARLSFSLATALFSTITIPANVAAQARFESRVDMVAVDVCATDHHGRPVPVESSDLAVYRL